MSTSETETQKKSAVAGTASAKMGPRRRGVFATAILVIGAIVLGFLAVNRIGAGEGTEALGDIPTAAVSRGRLVVTVSEGGTLRALESLEIKSEVEGNNQILEVVPEGTVITQQDVEAGKVLVRLDASDLEDTLTNRQMSFANAEAALIQAKQNYEIQLQQNESNEAAARLKVRFARMELARYLGEAFADRVLAAREQNAEADSFEQLTELATLEVHRIFQQRRDQADTTRVPDEAASKVDVEPVTARSVLADLYRMPASPPEITLGGVARQQLRELGAKVQLAGQELIQQRDQLYWTQRLVENEYETPSQLEEDRLRFDQRQVALDSATEELRLYIRYTLLKEAEQRLSDYVEAERELIRVLAQNTSEKAQAEANLKSKQATYDLEKERLEKTQEMIKKSTIRATRPGLVVYATTTSGRWGRDDPIAEGRMVRQNETIINMPNLSTLAARVNVHETDIAKIKPAQPAVITIEALSDQSFDGTVERLSPMASSEHRWLNPDTMVYETDVRLDEVPEGVTPGMSATAEIIVADLADVIYVPVQAVTTVRGERACFVKTPDGPQIRPVATGYFTDKYVEIREGLRQGEIVYLAPPEGLVEDSQSAEEGRPEEVPAGDGASGVAPAAEPEESAPQEQQQPARLDLGQVLTRLEGMSESERASYLQNLSDEQRRALFQQMRNLSEEDRERFRQLFGSGRGGGSGAGGRPRRAQDQSQ